MDPEALCERAAQLGYAEVGFAEHVDFFPGDEGFGYFDYEAYSREVERLRERFAGRLTVLKGVEVDFQERYLTDIARFLEGREFDFVIGSVHYLDGLFIEEEAFSTRTLAENYRIYCRETRALIRSKLFDILGHLDYISRRAVGRVDHAEVDCHGPAMAELAAEAARAGLLLEVNLQRGRLALPRPDALRAYLEAGGRGVTVGTDSHSLEQFEGGWERTTRYLASAGVREVVLLRARQARMQPL